MAAFLDSHKFSIWAILGMFLTETFPKLMISFKHFTLKKVALIFCLIGKIHHDYLIPRMIELAMSIQMLDFQRVKIIVALLANE